MQRNGQVEVVKFFNEGIWEIKDNDTIPVLLKQISNVYQMTSSHVFVADVT